MVNTGPPKDRKKAISNLAQRMQVRESREDHLYSDPRKTLKKTKSALRKDPENLMLLGTKAQCLMNLGRNQQAVETAQQAIAIRDSVVGRMILAKAYYALGSFEQAEQAIRPALDLRTKADKAAAHKLLAETLRKQKKYEEAIEVLDDAPVQHYGNELCRAYCLMEMGRLEQAFSAFSTAEELIEQSDEESPFLRRLRLYTGYVFLAQRYPEDEAVPSDLLDKRQQASDWLRNLNPRKVASTQKRDFHNALSILEKAGIIINERQFGAMISTAGSMMLQHPRKALAIIDKVEKHMEDNAAVTGIKANCLFLLGRTEEAEAYARVNILQNLRQQKKLQYIISSHVLLIRILLRQGKDKEACKLARNALSLQKSAALYALEAIALLKRKQYTKAELSIRQAMALNDHFNNVRILGQIYFASKRYPKALSVLNQLTRRQHNVYSLLYKCKSHLKLKQFNAALNALQAAEEEIEPQLVKASLKDFQQTEEDTEDRRYRELRMNKLDISICSIFICQGLESKGKRISNCMAKKACKAAAYLRDQDESQIPDELRQDYRKAMLISELNIQS